MPQTYGRVTRRALTHGAGFNTKINKDEERTFTMATSVRKSENMCRDLTGRQDVYMLITMFKLQSFYLNVYLCLYVGCK